MLLHEIKIQINLLDYYLIETKLEHFGKRKNQNKHSNIPIYKHFLEYDKNGAILNHS